MEIGYAVTFETARAALDPGEIRHVTDAVMKLQRGLDVGLHTLPPMAWMSFSVNQNAMRIICHREGNDLVLVHVGPHDKAYEWARRHKFRRHGHILRIVRTEVVTDEREETDVQEDRPPGPLHDVPDKWFRRLTIPEGLYPVLRQLPDDHVLSDLAQCLMPGLGEALLELVTEPDNWSEVVNKFLRRKEEEAKSAVPQPTLADALRHPSNAGAFWVPPGETALRRALEGEMSAWRVFLHPSQQRLVTKHAKGALKVTGGPGTGKTIVALHRARYLAEVVFADDDRPVLLTTFSKALSIQVEHLLDQLCDDAPDVRARIQVRTITVVSQQILRACKEPAELLRDDTVDRCWDEAMAFDSLDLSTNFYRSERRHVVEPSGAWNATQYLKVARTGRLKRLQRAQKKKVWMVLEKFEESLAKRRGGDGAALAANATRLLRTGKIESPWCAVVCDEVQDTGASQLRLLSALAANREDGKTRPNALFLAGDGYQRLYSTGVPLSRCGIQIVGRSYKLRINYRTTEGIRRAAVGVVKGIDVDELDKADEGLLGSLDGYRSLRPGARPETHSFADGGAEAAWIAQQVAAHSGTTLILARTKNYLGRLQQHLLDAGVSVARMGPKDEVPTAAATAALCSLHRSKGLEASRVIIAGRQGLPHRWHGDGDETDRRAWNRSESCLLYVGITRARDWCAITGIDADSLT